MACNRCPRVVGGFILAACLGGAAFSGCTALVDIPGGSINVSDERVYVNFPGLFVDVTDDHIYVDMPGVGVDLAGS
ncbi:MAG: hypothetical protein JSU63_04645 [Phycisphaerales bacterium]|nr:MAG: hypothetical protein JSU63_04645 [Phycisphaerales bacterium]